MTTTHIERTVERYDEDTDTYIEDDIVCTVLVHPAESDVGIMSPYAEIDMIECNGKPWPHTLHPNDKQAIEIMALELSPSSGSYNNILYAHKNN